MRNSVARIFATGQIVEYVAIGIGLVAAWYVFAGMPPVVKVFVAGALVPFLAEFSMTMAARYRPEMSTKEAFARLMPMSVCDGCRLALGWRALPFIQMVIGRGRCACGSLKIDRSYTFSAIFAFMAFICVSVAVGLAADSQVASKAALIFLVGLPLAIMDYEHQEIDEAMVAVSVGLALVIGAGSISPLNAMIFAASIGMAGLLASLMRGETALGFMDLIAGAVFGAFLSTDQVLVAFGSSGIFLAIFVAGAVVRDIWKKVEVDVDRPFPFVPAMWAGCLMAILVTAFVAGRP